MHARRRREATNPGESVAATPRETAVWPETAGSITPSERDA